MSEHHKINNLWNLAKILPSIAGISVFLRQLRWLETFKDRRLVWNGFCFKKDGFDVSLHSVKSKRAPKCNKGSQEDTFSILTWPRVRLWKIYWGLIWWLSQAKKKEKRNKINLLSLYQQQDGGISFWIINRVITRPIAYSSLISLIRPMIIWTKIYSPQSILVWDSIKNIPS